jgi:hypothetical protein
MLFKRLGIWGAVMKPNLGGYPHLGVGINELQATLKDDSSKHGQTEKTSRQPTLRKIKRGVLPTHLPTQKHHI